MSRRNTNIELLRIISMFMVLGLHSLDVSGALDYLSGINYFAYWGLEAFCIVAVDCFILISGYFMINSRFRAQNLLRVVGGVWSYTIIFSALGYAITGSMPGKMDIIKMMFPIITKKFWFVNSYLALYLISPFLNKLIHSLTKKQFEYLLLLLIVLFPLRLTFLPLTWSQDGSGGMSVILFIVLYCIAAWLRLYYSPENPLPGKYALCYLGTALFLVLSKWILLKIISEPYTTKLYGYISIFTIIAAISLFLFFLYSRSISGWTEKLVLKVAPHSFAVYIIHFCMVKALFCNVLHLDDVIPSAVIGIPAVILSCILVFSVCILIDIGRTAIARRIVRIIRRKGGLHKYDSLIERWNQFANVAKLR